MLRIRGSLSDGADAVDPSGSDPVARDDGLSAFPQFGAGGGAVGANVGGSPGGGSGPQPSVSGVAAMAQSDLSSNPQPSVSGVAAMADSELLSNLQPLASGVAAMPDSDLSPNPPTLHIAYDPLAAFLDGLNGFPSLGGAGTSPFLPHLSLSNGLNADAGVAQLVSALASVPDGNSAFNATPFAPPSNPEPQTIVAAATQ